MFEIVEIQGENEAGEAVAPWGYGVFSHTSCRMVSTRVFKTREEAEKAARDHEAEIQAILNPISQYKPVDCDPR